MKTITKRLFVAVIFLAIIAGGCGSGPSVSGPDELDLAIRDASDYLNDNIPEGSMIVILNVQSDSAALSEYVIDELIANAVNDRIFKVVDRQQLDLIRTEQDFQLSGEVDDNLALSIGKFFGAQTIVSGRVSQVGERFRMTIRALDVLTAQVQGQYNRNIAAGKTITALMGAVTRTQSTAARATGSGSSTTATTGGTASMAAPPAPTVTGVAVSPGSASVDKGKTQQFTATITGTNNPDPSVTWTVTGYSSGNTSISADGLLTVGTDEAITPLTVTATSAADRSKSASVSVEVPGGMAALSVNSAATWNAAINRIRNGGSGQTYVINVTGTVSVPAPQGEENLFGSVTGLTVIIQGGGTLSLSANGALLRIGAGQTVIARNITLRGRSGNDLPVVVIGAAGTFRMEAGSTVSGNTAGGYGGGGVRVDGGSFAMSGGTISGNTDNSLFGGGGVYVRNGSFTMSGGTISGNICGSLSNNGGGGVCVGGGSFTMSGGTISANSAGGNGGGGVYVDGTFTMTGGTISGNTSSGLYGGGGVCAWYGTFTMRGGAISGNNASRNGGGVYVNNGPLNKTGGTISGSDSTQSPGNTARQGHAVYWWASGDPRWRNATAGPDDGTEGYGFWLND